MKRFERCFSAQRNHQVIYFSRSLVDLDFNLPLLSFFQEGTIVLYDTYFIPEQINFYLEKNSIKVLRFSKVFYSLFAFYKKRRTPYILKRLFLPTLLKVILNTLRNTLHIDKKIYFLFDHTDSEYVKSLCYHLNMQYQGLCKIDSVPHGVDLFENQINDYGVTSLPTPAHLKNFRKVFVTNSLQAKKIFADKKMLIPSLRYSKHWLESFDRLIDNEYPELLRSKNNQVLSKCKTPILIVHSKMSGNLNYEEFIRSIQILSKSNSFVPFLKFHPRTTSSERRRILSQVPDLNILDSTSFYQCSRLFDHFLVIQTSSVLELFAREKIVHLLGYATTNRLSKSIRENCNFYETPDELFHLANTPLEKLKLKRSRALEIELIMQLGN